MKVYFDSIKSIFKEKIAIFLYSAPIFFPLKIGKKTPTEELSPTDFHMLFLMHGKNTVFHKTP